MTANLPSLMTQSWPDSVTQSISQMRWIASVPTLPAEAALSGLDRQWVEVKVQELHQRLQPTEGDNEAKGRALVGLFLVYPAQQTGEQEATVKAGQYLKALSEYPAWAVEQACDDWLACNHEQQGENRAFAPSPPQLVRLVRIAVHDTRAAVSKLQSLLTAKVEKAVDPEARERVGAQIIELAGKLAANQQSED